MKKTFYVSLTLLLLMSTVLCYADVNKYLSYHKTNFNNTSWFPILQNVIINTDECKMYIKEGLTGYAYTKELLENETGCAFSFMVNVTIDKKSNLNIYISYDNSTWIMIQEIDKTGCFFNNIEKYNYTSLYFKFEFIQKGKGYVEVSDFWFTNVFSPLDIVDESNYLWVGLILFFVLIGYYVLR